MIVRPPGHRPGLTDRHVIAASCPGLSQQLPQQETTSSTSSVHLTGGMGLAKETGLGFGLSEDEDRPFHLLNCKVYDKNSYYTIS